MRQYQWLLLSVMTLVFFAKNHAASVFNEEADSQVGEQQVVEITDANFDLTILSSTQPVILMIYADWCCCCCRFQPILQALAQEYGDVVRFGKINYEKQYELAALYQPAYVPTFVCIKQGLVINQTDDIESREDLESQIVGLIGEVN